ncbi:hypothetical protein D3C72_1752000 [compost metagenome]
MQAVPVERAAGGIEKRKAAIGLFAQGLGQAMGQDIPSLQMPQALVRQRNSQRLREIRVGRVHETVRPIGNALVQVLA